MQETKQGQALRYEFPEHLKRTLKRGEFAVYRLLDAFDGEGRFRGRTASIPSKDLIVDDKGNMFPIAFVSSYRADGTPVLGHIWFLPDNLCQIVLSFGARDAMAYNYMEVCNYNKSNPDRDQNAPAFFERVDSSNGAKEMRDARGIKLQAMNAAKAMTDDEILKFINANQKRYKGLHISMRPDSSFDFVEMRNSVEIFAEKQPHAFIGAAQVIPVEATDEGVLDVILWAQKAGIIGYDKETKSWFNVKSGKAILKTKSGKMDQAQNEMVKYLESESGVKLLDILRKSKEEA